jgi:hypothetical protein
MILSKRNSSLPRHAIISSQQLGFVFTPLAILRVNSRIASAVSSKAYAPEIVSQQLTPMTYGILVVNADLQG